MDREATHQTPGLLFCLLVGLVVPLSAVSPVSSGWRAWSSCAQPTPWTRGRGFPIRSWLLSVVPIPPGAAGVNLTVEADFQPVELAHSDPDEGDGETMRDFRLMRVCSTLSGICWERFGPNPMDGWLYGVRDSAGHWSGHHISYIYSDYDTAIQGLFQQSQLVAGRECRVTHWRCQNAVLELKLSQPLRPLDHLFSFEEVRDSFLTSHPTLMDPLDRRNTFVSQSTIDGMQTGEGLFARRDIPAFSLVVIYAGFVQSNRLRLPDNLTRAEREHATMNLLGLNETHNINLPDAFSDVVQYRASLGHKANHRFRDENAEFCRLKHPRFGETRCLKSTRAIRAGEEIFENYCIDLRDYHAPIWYRELHRRLYASTGKVGVAAGRTRP